jgi:hypothetical protein
MAPRAAAGLLYLVFAVCLLAVSNAESIKAEVNPFDRTCNYTAKNIPAKLFFNGSSPSAFFSSGLFPLEDSASPIYEYNEGSWKACFGPSEPFDLELIKNGLKLPCHYTKNPDGTVSYWEEHACDILLKSNCYCFALNRYVGSFCEPGYGSMPKDEQAELDVTCEDQIKGLVADGAVKVDRDTVYNVPPKGHYIAMAIWPHEDFHFWRLDADGAWANKPGMLMSRRVFNNGTKISDIEHPDARGSYTDFCGYFEVFPETHNLKGNGYWHSDIPQRFQDWKEMGIQRAPPRPLPKVSQAWRYAYPRYWKIFNTNRPRGISRVAVNRASMSSRPRDK